MGDYPRSCDDVKKDLNDRHQLFPDVVLKPIGEDAVLHRLVKESEIDYELSKPSKSSFTNHGLSVFVQSETYPLDITKLVEDSDIFVGSVQLDPEKLREMGYEIWLDPHPDPSGNKQHPNHAQVVCKKTQGNTKKLRADCKWSVRPSVLPTELT